MMRCTKIFILLTGLLVLASTSWAQRRESMEPGTEPRVDIVGMGGYVWTVSRDATYNANTGKVDLKSNGYWGIAADVYAVDVMQFRLLYRRQDTQLTFKQAGVVSDVSDMAVEYWHIGAVKGIPQGNVRPFTTFTLGATRFIYDGGDDWKFSMIFGLGTKVHFNPRLGIMLAGNAAISFTDAFVGIGTGGLSLGGSGIWQFDLAAGVILTL